MLKHFNRRVPRVALVLLLATLVSIPSAGRGTADAGSAFSFTNYGLASTTDIVCPSPPGSTSVNPCYNDAGEPQTRAANDGALYTSAAGSGLFAWKSDDGGRHYRTLPAPDPLALSSGDADVAIAPVKNPIGFYNIYLANLGFSNVDVITSRDGGQTWTVNPLGALVPGTDRPWLAADGAAKVCLSYISITTGDLLVNCSVDGGSTFSQLASALDPDHLWLLRDTAPGNLVIDPRSHTMYQIFTSNRTESESLSTQRCSPNRTSCDAVWIAVSTDGGNTFTDHLVYASPDPSVNYAKAFPNLSVDRAGNLYAVFSDGHNVYYSVSTAQGETWSASVQVNRSPANTAIMPWSVAGDAEQLDIVWYGTSYVESNVLPDDYPDGVAWYVFFAQNLRATTPGSSFTQAIASPVVHTGNVCQQIAPICNSTGKSRDLLDDFGVAASPKTGTASIIYTSDQYTADPNNPPNAACTQDSDNTSACIHTSVATQLDGPGIFDAR